MANILINNAHYVVSTQYSTNAVGGSNPDGRTVFIRQKRTGNELQIPMNVWEKIVMAVEGRSDKAVNHG